VAAQNRPIEPTVWKESGRRIAAPGTLAMIWIFVCMWQAAQAAQPAGLLESFGRSALIIVPQSGPCVFVDIYIADRPELQSQGLMYIKNMPKYEGMLFVYGTARYISMWMKNTLIPLDMVFIDGNLKIVNIASDTVPGSTESIKSAAAVNLVLELNAGLAELWNLRPGDAILIAAGDKQN